MFYCPFNVARLDSFELFEQRVNLLRFHRLVVILDFLIGANDVHFDATNILAKLAKFRGNEVLTFSCLETSGLEVGPEILLLVGQVIAPVQLLVRCVDVRLDQNDLPAIVVHLVSL